MAAETSTWGQSLRALTLWIALADRFTASANPTRRTRRVLRVAIAAPPIKERLRGLLQRLLLYTRALHATATAAGILARTLLHHLDHSALALDRGSHLGVVAIDVLAEHELAVLDGRGLVSQMHRDVGGKLDVDL